MKGERCLLPDWVNELKPKLRPVVYDNRCLDASNFIDAPSCAEAFGYLFSCWPVAVFVNGVGARLDGLKAIAYVVEDISQSISLSDAASCSTNPSRSETHSDLRMASKYWSSSGALRIAVSTPDWKGFG